MRQAGTFGRIIAGDRRTALGREDRFDLLVAGSPWGDMALDRDRRVACGFGARQ